MLRVASVLVLLALGAADADHDQATRIDALLQHSSQLESRLSALESSAAAPRQLEEATAVEQIAELATCLDYMWLLICGALVMFMQAGFAVLESGACRAKNAATVLMKNGMDICVGTIMWWLVGYGLAYGADNPNQFIGTSNFAGMGFMETDAAGNLTGSAHFRDWFFQWAFCATAATIVSGAVAERIHVWSYVLYSMVMTGLIYPVVVYWTWCGEGWLYKMGYSDFAGSGIVHMVGGIGALVGAVIVGPRSGRWDPKNAERFQPHNMGMVVLGTLILWFGWYGFNCGSTLSFHDVATVTLASLVAMNTTLAAAFGGITVFLVRYVRTRKCDLAGMCNGILVGLVAVCAGVGAIHPGMAALTGFLGGLAHELGHELMMKLHIDDPLDAFAVHGCGGIIGVLTRPLFDRKGADGHMFGVHCLAIVCIAAWTAGLSVMVLGPMRLAGVLTTSEEEQEVGSDTKVLANPDCYRPATKDIGSSAVASN